VAATRCVHGSGGRVRHVGAFPALEDEMCAFGPNGLESGRFNTMPDERVDIVDYLDMIRVYLLTILDICEVA
jgi:phage terminase large subunit-like protein